jgi:putative nucleotidyltransferase with HDIG domain
MRGTSTTSKHGHPETVRDNYLPIHVRSLRVDTVLNFDLYLYSSGEMILYRASHLPFTTQHRSALLENGVRHIYVPMDSGGEYRKYMGANIGDILKDSDIDDFTKANIVYDCTKDVIADVMRDPTRKESIQQSQIMVESTVLYILEGQNVFHNMLRVMSFDYSLYTHSVNVCTFSLALAHASGIDCAKSLEEIGTGALLHDVGKIKVDDSILNKKGPLTPQEIELIRRHPKWGVELVRSTDLVPEDSYEPIQQHHERTDGSGYPDGIKAEEIHLYGRIVAIADMFDAMTTERVYRRAVESFTALKAMVRDSHQLDKDLLNRFVQLMGPTKLANI